MEKYTLTTQMEAKYFITWANEHDIDLDNIVLGWVDNNEHEVKTLQGWLYLCIVTYLDERYDLDDPVDIVSVDNILLKAYQALIDLVRQQVEESIKLSIEEAKKHV